MVKKFKTEIKKRELDRPGVYKCPFCNMKFPTQNPTPGNFYCLSCLMGKTGKKIVCNFIDNIADNLDS